MYFLISFLLVVVIVVRVLLLLIKKIFFLIIRMDNRKRCMNTAPPQLSSIECVRFNICVAIIYTLLQAH